jgi:hypothetical protein
MTPHDANSTPHVLLLYPGNSPLVDVTVPTFPQSYAFAVTRTPPLSFIAGTLPLP